MTEDSVESTFAPKNWTWTNIPWPESEGGDGKLRAYLICMACDGSGQYSDYCARVLAGEFPIRQTPADFTKDFAGKWSWTSSQLDNSIKSDQGFFQYPPNAP